MTDEEKLVKLREAVGLVTEAIANMQKAKKLFKKCGIELCGDLNFNEVDPWTGGCNIQIFKGINKFEKLIGASAYFRDDIITEKTDTSRKYLDYKGIVFLQLGHEITARQAKFTFK